MLRKQEEINSNTERPLPKIALKDLKLAVWMCDWSLSKYSGFLLQTATYQNNAPEEKVLKVQLSNINISTS